jgi:hypothetical protein
MNFQNTIFEQEVTEETEIRNIFFCYLCFLLFD